MHSLLDRAKNSYKNSRKPFLLFRHARTGFVVQHPNAFYFILFFKKTFFPGLNVQWMCPQTTLKFPNKLLTLLLILALHQNVYCFVNISEYKISSGFSSRRCSTSDIFFSQEQQLNKTNKNMYMQKLYTNILPHWLFDPSSYLLLLFSLIAN